MTITAGGRGLFFLGAVLFVVGAINMMQVGLLGAAAAIASRISSVIGHLAGGAGAEKSVRRFSA
jgi:hypothetical protein